jgi:hypothetical protein
MANNIVINDKGCTVLVLTCHVYQFSDDTIKIFFVRSFATNTLPNVPELPLRAEEVTFSVTRFTRLSVFFRKPVPITPPQSSLTLNNVLII